MSIWKYREISELIPASNQLSLGEGSTPLMKIFIDKYEQRSFGIKSNKTIKVYLKIETVNPNNSFKDRSLSFQISNYLNKDEDRLLISSSGNAAVSAAAYTSLTDMHLAVFVSTHINKEKLKRLNEIARENDKITINFSDRPKSDAVKFAQTEGYVNLRGSTDDSAVTGFKTIAYELQEELPSCDAIFIPCSSGTSTKGIADGYADHPQFKLPSINVCQTTKIHPIAKEFDVLYTRTDGSLADAIADRVAHRKGDILDIVNNSNGAGWVINDELIKSSVEFLKKRAKIPFLTYNGILSFAGFIKAIKRKKYYENPVCIISGI